MAKLFLGLAMLSAAIGSAALAQDAHQGAPPEGSRLNTTGREFSTPRTVSPASPEVGEARRTMKTISSGDTAGVAADAASSPHARQTARAADRTAAKRASRNVEDRPH